jgi:cyclic nucleotide-binding protein
MLTPAGAAYSIVAGSLPRPHPRYGLPLGTALFVNDYIALPVAGLYKPIWQYDAKTLAWGPQRSPRLRRGQLAEGTLLAGQGDPGHDISLLLDGVLSVSVDGTQVGELGPGAVVGERALLEDGRRTATLRAVTDCVVATAAKDQIDRGSLSSLAELHHREDADR